MAPELNRRRGLFVLGKIDEILPWEKSREQEKDVRFVKLGEYLCEVRTKQSWKWNGVRFYTLGAQGQGSPK